MRLGILGKSSLKMHFFKYFSVIIIPSFLYVHCIVISYVVKRFQGTIETKALLLLIPGLRMRGNGYLDTQSTASIS